MDYKEFEKFIEGEKSRNFIDKSINKQIHNKLSNKEGLAFWINDTSEQDEYDTYNKRMGFVITLYGVLEDGRSAVAKINDYKPFIDVLLTPKNHKVNEPSERITPNIKEFIHELGALYTEIKHNKEQSHFPKGNAESMVTKVIDYANYAQDGYKPNDVHNTFIRLVFDRQKSRKLMLQKLIQERYTTVNDDKNDLYCVLFRNKKGLIPSSWCYFDRYRLYKKDGINIDNIYNDRNCMVVSHKNLKPVPEDYKLPNRPPATALAWDIETFHKDHELPLWNNGGYMFMIGVAIGWIYENTSSYNLLITEKPKDGLVPHFEKDGVKYKVINCKNENEVVKAFLITLAEFKPQFTMQFNGWGYDDPFIKDYISKNKNDGELKDLVKKIHWVEPFYDKPIFNTRDLKITASFNKSSTFITIPGMCELDLMVVHMKLNMLDQMPKLNDLLEKSKLAGKNDLPIPTMFDYYEEKTSEKMAIVSDYCMMDCVRTFELASKRKFIFDKIEEAVASFININQAILLANGRRVRNITCQWGFDRNIYFSNYMTYEDSEDDEKYEGAYVVPPIKGLKTSVLNPTERVKHAKTSAYDTYITWKNLTEDELKIIDEEIFYGLLYLKKRAGHISNEIEFKKFMYDNCDFHFKYKNGKMINKIKKFTNYVLTQVDDHDVDFEIDENDFEEMTLSRYAIEVIIDIIKNNKYPISGLDFASLYPSIIMGFNLSPEMRMTEKQYNDLTEEQQAELLDGVTKITIKNKGKEEIYYFKKHRPDESNHGIFPAILAGLFKTRKACKNKMLKLQKRVERKHIEPLTDDELSDLLFEIGCLDSKQKALKVLMNTFYGESGNSKSTIYMLSIAAGITGKGRENLKYVKSVLAEKSIEPDYGDTDSLYIQQAMKHFFNINIQYYGAKISKAEYWKKLFYVTDKHLSITKDDVNEKLMKYNNTPRLKMDFEEQLFPAIMYSKKIYEGVENATIYNTDLKHPHYFVRGLQKKRKNANKAVKYASNKVSEEAMCIDNILSLKEVTENAIIDICSREWTLDDFKQSIMFRTGYKTDTCTVPQLIKRFKEEGKPMPKMGRRTFIVHVLKEVCDYTISGNIIKHGKAYYAELYDYAKEHEMKPWLMHYFESIAGQYGRFIASYYVEDAMIKKYNKVVDVNTMTDEEIDTIDKSAMAMGKKYCIEMFEKQLGIEPVNHAPMKSLISKVGKKTNNFVLETEIKNINTRIDKIIAKRLTNEKINKQREFFNARFKGQVYNNSQWITHVGIKRQRLHSYKIELNKLENELNKIIKSNIEKEEELMKSVKDKYIENNKLIDDEDELSKLMSDCSLTDCEELKEDYKLKYYNYNYEEKYINMMDCLIRGN